MCARRRVYQTTRFLAMDAGTLPRHVVCLLVLLVAGASSLKNLKITVPERVRVDDSALLTCSYDMEAPLYTVKWYLNEEEFYSYVPAKQQPQSTFNVSNIQVNLSSSNMHDVTLVKVQRNHTGRYKCEISEDFPNFDTSAQEANVLVVDVPESEPRIAVDKQHLPAGETLRANCTSGASRPAPNITWILNGAPLNNRTMQFKTHTWTYKANVHRYDDKNYTHSILNLDTTGMFHDGRIKVKCYAEITPVYKASHSIEITEDGPYLASITGDASPHSRQSSGCGRVNSVALTLVLGLLLGGAGASTR